MLIWSRQVIPLGDDNEGNLWGIWEWHWFSQLCLPVDIQSKSILDAASMLWLLAIDVNQVNNDHTHSSIRFLLGNSLKLAYRNTVMVITVLETAHLFRGPDSVTNTESALSLSIIESLAGSNSPVRQDENFGTLKRR